MVAGISGLSEWSGQIASGELRVLGISAPERQAGIDIASSALKLDAAIDRKDAANSRADSMEIQALMQMLDDLIDMAMSMLMQVNNNVQAMMDSLTEMLTDTGNTLANTKFAG